MGFQRLTSCLVRHQLQGCVCRLQKSGGVSRAGEGFSQTRSIAPCSEHLDSRKIGSASALHFCRRERPEDLTSLLQTRKLRQKKEGTDRSPSNDYIRPTVHPATSPPPLLPKLSSQFQERGFQKPGDKVQVTGRPKLSLCECGVYTLRS